MIHGDNATNNASTGCIILGRAFREQIRDSGDNRLQVVGTSVFSLVGKIARRPAKGKKAKRKQPSRPAKTRRDKKKLVR